MTRRLLIGTALAVALVLTWLAWDGWFYLQHGYALGARLEGERGSIFHIDFPAWRAAVHILLWLAAMGAIGAYIAGRSSASAAAWLTFTATIVLGIYDVVQHGTMGSPTSIWTLLALLVFALLVTFRPLAPTAEI